MKPRPDPDTVDRLAERLAREAAEGGYNLNPDSAFTRQLVESLVINIDRYGYASCPCRLASGRREDDLDIICPCDYRDPDLDQYGACYCALYVSDEIAGGHREAEPIPERRPVGGRKEQAGGGGAMGRAADLSYPVWRCRVCGYLCARDEPPGRCPVCKADKDRFEKFA